MSITNRGDVFGIPQKGAVTFGKTEKVAKEQKKNSFTIKISK
jgi:hypothetical protein